MQRPSLKQIAGLVVVACASAALAGGCSAGDTFDYTNGRTLFIEKCGTCHTLAEAATAGEVGPNLDAAFAQARHAGMDSDTVKGIVAGQIENPRGSDPESVNTYMPAELVTGDDAADVAYYVGKVAGVPGIGPPEAPGGPGGQVFANNGCGSCHTLEGFPNASGTLGPDLTETLPGQSPQDVEQSIVDPDADVVQGFDPVMPTNYGDEIQGDDLQALVDFLISWSSNSGGGN